MLAAMNPVVIFPRGLVVDTVPVLVLGKVARGALWEEGKTGVTVEVEGAGLLDRTFPVVLDGES